MIGNLSHLVRDPDLPIGQAFTLDSSHILCIIFIYHCALNGAFPYTNMDPEIMDVTWQMLILGGLSLSLGWGIRGNFGHETGAAIPGALAAMGIVLVSGRPDWWPRITYFAMFGALGWSFGGSMSYMHVVSYTHSGHPTSVLYGFANLFVIGFLWASLGGAGTALPALLSSEQLCLFFVPLIAIFIGWGLRSVILDLVPHVNSAERHRSRLYWYDTDWLATLIAFAVTILVIIFRGRIDMATSLILHLTIGWYASFLLLVNVLKIRMTPPRGDNWSGCLGMVMGLLVYCWRHSLSGLASAALATGFIGGIGFALGQLLKLIYIKTGLKANWHSVMEQTQGLFHGVGLAVTMSLLASRAPSISNEHSLSPWMLVFSVSFVLVLLTYLNHKKAVGTWVQQVESLPEKFYGLPASGLFRPRSGMIGWFELVYIGIGIAVVWLSAAHLRNPLAFVPSNWLGKGQLLYVIFLWWIVVFNFERALVGFTPQRLVTEGIITWNAIICTVFVGLAPQNVSIRESVYQTGIPAEWIVKVLSFGLAAVVLITMTEWLITHALYGHQHAPGAGLHIRFGPNSTATKAKPQAGQKHP